jgi:hypothetical protein
VLGIPSGVIATCFALVCFAAAVIVGLFAGNSALTVLWRSLLVMLGAWIVGRLAGAVVERALNEKLETYRQANPLPGEQPKSTEPATETPAAEPAGGQAGQQQTAGSTN